MDMLGKCISKPGKFMMCTAQLPKLFTMQMASIAFSLEVVCVTNPTETNNIYLNVRKNC